VNRVKTGERPGKDPYRLALFEYAPRLWRRRRWQSNDANLVGPRFEGLDLDIRHLRRTIAEADQFENSRRAVDRTPTVDD